MAANRCFPLIVIALAVSVTLPQSFSQSTTTEVTVQKQQEALGDI
jgi:hypothetical protein